MKSTSVKKSLTVAALCMVFLFVHQAYAQTTTTVPDSTTNTISEIDDFGNSCATAQPVAFNDTINGAINTPGDYDYFKIDVLTPGFLTAYTTGDTDTHGYLKDENCSDIAENEDVSLVSDWNFFISRYMTAGTYYIAVRQYDNVTTGEYTLHLSPDSFDDYGNSCAEAAAIQLFTPISGEINYGGDYDYFRIEVDSPGRLIAYTTGQTDTIGYLSDADCNIITLTSGCNDDNRNFLISRDITAGTYYIAVSHCDPNDIGAYALQVDFADDYGNNCAEAAPIQFSTPMNGVIDYAGDYDYFSIEVYEPGTLTAYTTGQTDTYGYLSDADCIPIAENDGVDGVLDNNFLISKDITPGTYYIAVRHSDPNGTGAYALQVDFASFIHDDYGNSCGDAFQVGEGAFLVETHTWLNGVLNTNDDSDYFKIDLATAGTLTAYTTGQTNTYGYLKDSGCSIIAANDNVTDRNFSITTALPAGTYYIAVQNYTGEADGIARLEGGIGPYTLHFDFTPGYPQAGWLIKKVVGGGTPPDGFGDNGYATAATLFSPGGVAVDAAGNLYIADSSHNRIRKVDILTRNITTVAGCCLTSCKWVDGVPATQSLLADPEGIAVDGLGNLYIADSGHARIRKVDTAGIITTVAGYGYAYPGVPLGDNGPATQATLSFPVDIALDGLGNLYIADLGNNRIRKVNARGIITTVAGGGDYADGLGDNGYATAASLSSPSGVTVDSRGTIYIADTRNNRIRKVDNVNTAGIITTVAGTGADVYSGDNVPATVAALNNPRSVALDAAANLYIADSGNNRIRKVDTSGIISTVAGTITPGYSGDNATASAAMLNSPAGIALDNLGTIYIADSANNVISRVFYNGCIDHDGDGYGVGLGCLGPDCDDNNAAVHPGAVDVYNGIDDDCDGQIDGGDSDHDGIPDAIDNCPNNYNPLQLDANNNGLGDVCDPSPGCGGCGQAACEQYADSDGDGIPDAVDNCPNIYNPLQQDDNHNGIGNACDAATCPAPEHYQPSGSGGPADSTRRTFSWKLAGREAFQLQVWSWAVMGISYTSDWLPAGTVCINETCTYRPDKNFPDGWNWWWVNTRSFECGEQFQPFSYSMPFEITPCPGGPELYSPSGTVSFDINPVFSWQQMAPEMEYQIIIWTVVNGLKTQAFASQWYTSAACSGGVCSATPSATPELSLSRGEASWGLNTRSPECGLQSQPGGYFLPISVEVVKPTVTIAASPDTLNKGETATITWNSQNALSCTIQPGNQLVGTNGLITVSPTETTTYTIRAKNFGAESDQVPVTVKIRPTVTISADPPVINSGDETTIKWETTDAVSCRLDPGSESVGINGSVEKSITQPTTYTITATGIGGATAIVSVTVNIIKTDAIHITYPTEGQLIKRPDTLVRGTIDNLGGDDIGVVVNGVVANVYEGEFAANHVPLRQGDNNTISAIATSSNDYVGKDNITVSADTNGRNVALYSDKQSGLMPLDIALKLTKSIDNSTYSLSYTPDNDSMENLGDNNTSLQFMRRITKPGLYFITVDDTETHDNGTVINHSDTISVMVESPMLFDAKLQGKWDGMKTSFAGSDIPQSLKYYSILSNDKYCEIFTEFADQLPSIASEMQAIELVYVEENIAKYRIVREETISGQVLPIVYDIYFIKDMNGLWKIEKW